MRRAADGIVDHVDAVTDGAVDRSDQCGAVAAVVGAGLVGDDVRARRDAAVRQERVARGGGRHVRAVALAVDRVGHAVGGADEVPQADQLVVARRGDGRAVAEVLTFRVRDAAAGKGDMGAEDAGVDHADDDAFAAVLPDARHQAVPHLFGTDPAGAVVGLDEALEFGTHLPHARHVGDERGFRRRQLQRDAVGGVRVDVLGPDVAPEARADVGQARFAQFGEIVDVGARGGAARVVLGLAGRHGARRRELRPARIGVEAAERRRRRFVEHDDPRRRRAVRLHVRRAGRPRLRGRKRQAQRHRDGQHQRSCSHLFDPHEKCPAILGHTGAEHKSATATPGTMRRRMR